LTAAAFALLLSLTATDEPYHWPLDLPKQLTSSFAEYRPGRFHAGIDLRTGGIGIPVHAPADGYVSRVRCSPYGYGKAVYLTLDDGNTVVYGHLDDYADGLKAYVRARQHATESYTVDLYPDAGDFPVKRGELVAKSGQTGIGAPHLHYEIRDAAQRPINPRLLGIDWPDTRAPEIRKLAIVPLDLDSRVNGGLEPVVVEVTHLGNGRYQVAPVNATGRIALGLDVIDADGGYRLGVHELRLRVNDEDRFVMRHDRLSYDNHRNAAVSYHPFLAKQGRFLLLWRWPGNVCESYAASPDDGTIVVGEEPCEAEVAATDDMGNTAALRVPIRPGSDTNAAAALAPGKVDWTCYGLGADVSVALPDAAREAPAFALEGYGDILPIRAIQTAPNQYAARVAPEHSGAYTLHVTHPLLETQEFPLVAMRRGEPASNVRLGDVGLGLKPNSPYGVLVARAYALAEAPRAAIPRYGAAYRIWPDAMPIDETINISIPVPEGISDLAKADVFRSSGSSWSRQGAEIRGGRFHFETRSFGTFAVLEDTTAPTLDDVLPAQGYRAQTRRPLIQATIGDVGSGIDRIDVRCDGKWLLVAYDPERQHIAWERDEELTPGTHEIVFTITDNAGNTTTRTRTVTVPD